MGRCQVRAGVPWNGPGSPRTGMSGGCQAVVRGDRLGDRSPLRRVPSLRRCRHRAVDADEHERRQRLQPERLDDGAVVVDEHEELPHERTEERPGVLLRGGDEKVHAGIGAAQAFEDPRRRRQDPRRLIGVRVEGDRGQVERGQPFGQRPGSPPSGVNTRSAGGSLATGCDGSKARARGCNSPHARQDVMCIRWSGSATSPGAAG